MSNSQIKKNGNKEGSIYKRADGRWVGQVALPGDSRVRRRRKWVYGRTRAEVATKKIEAQKSLIDGQDINVENVMFESYALQWLKRKKIEVKQRTWEGYESRVRVHLLPAFAGRKIRSLKPDHLRDLYSDVMSRGISARTVRHIHTILQSILKTAEQDGLLPRNVALLVKPPRVVRREIKTLTPDEARRLINGAIGHADAALFVMALTTGLRLGELLGLRWKDVDTGRSTARILQSLSWIKGGWALDEPKTAGSRRQIKLTELATASLITHRSKQAETMLRSGPIWSDHDLVFASRIGTPRTLQSVTQRSFKPLLRRLGIPIVRFHDLRHTAATLLLGEGVHPKIVSEMLGHSSVQITLDTYSHVTPTMQQQATDAMESILVGS